MVELIEKLQKRAKELDRRVRNSLIYDGYGYDSVAADDRDLLEEAVKAVQRSLLMMTMAESVIYPKIKYD